MSEKIVAYDGHMKHWYTGEEIVRCRCCEHSLKDGTLCQFFASWVPVAGAVTSTRKCQPSWSLTASAHGENGGKIMKVKSCPFCCCARVWLEHGEIYPASNNYGGERWYEVGCKICGGRMVGFGKEAVIRAWNRRAHEEVIEHEV